MVVVKGVDSTCMNDCFYRILGFMHPDGTPRQFGSAYLTRLTLLENSLGPETSESEQAELREALSCIDTAHRVLQNARLRAAYRRSRTVDVSHRCSQFSRARRVLDIVDLKDQIRKLQAELEEKEAALSRLTGEVSDLMRQLDIKNEQLSNAEGAASEKDSTIDQLRQEIDDLKTQINRLTEQLNRQTLGEVNLSPVVASLNDPSASFLRFVDQVAGPSVEEEPLREGSSSSPVDPSPSEEPLHGEAATAHDELTSVKEITVPPVAADTLEDRVPDESSPPRDRPVPPVRRRKRFVPSSDQQTCTIVGLKFRSQGPMFFVKFSPDQEGHEEKHAEDIVEAFPEESAAFMRGLRERHPRQVATLRKKRLNFLLDLM